METAEKYDAIIHSLEMEIKNQFGSVLKCASAADVDYFNLNKILRGHQDISIGTYLKLCTTLGIIARDIVSETQYRNAGTLREWLCTPYQLINESIIEIILK